MRIIRDHLLAPWRPGSQALPLAETAGGPDLRDAVESVRPDTRRHPVRDLLRGDSPGQEGQSRQLCFIITGPVTSGATEETGSTPEQLTLSR